MLWFMMTVASAGLEIEPSAYRTGWMKIQIWPTCHLWSWTLRQPGPDREGQDHRDRSRPIGGPCRGEDLPKPGQPSAQNPPTNSGTDGHNPEYGRQGTMSGGRSSPSFGFHDGSYPGRTQRKLRSEFSGL